MNEIFGILLRHMLTAGGAVLVTKGYADAATVDALAGAVATVAGFALSVRQKRKSGVL